MKNPKECACIRQRNTIFTKIRSTQTVILERLFNIRAYLYDIQ